MATIKFDKDAVSENIRTLISIGIGSTSPDGVPSFGNADVELHQEAINRTGTPISATTPLGQNISGLGMNFRQLDDPSRQGEDNAVLRIGELQGKKFENQARLEESIRKDIAFSSAQNQVDVLTDALRLMPPGDRKNEVTRGLTQATQIRDKALENATRRASSELNTQNALLDADIARLEAQRVALAERAAKIGKEKDVIFPPTTVNAVISSGVVTSPLDADKFLRSSPDATKEMFRQGGARFNTGKPLEYWDGLIDAGGRTLYQDFLVNSVPLDQQDNMRAAIVKMDETMLRARTAAKDEVDKAIKAGGTAKLKEFNDNPELRAQEEFKAFDTIMRQTNYNNYQARVLGASPTDIDQSWFGQNQDDYEIAKVIQGMVNPNASSIESAYAAAAKSVMETRGISQQRAVGIVGKMLDNYRSQFNSVHKPLGASVSQQRYDGMLQAFSFNMITIDKIRVDQQEQGPALVVGGDLPPSPGIKAEDINKVLKAIGLDFSSGGKSQVSRRTQTGQTGNEGKPRSDFATGRGAKLLNDATERQMREILKQFELQGGDTAQLEEIINAVKTDPQFSRVTTPGVRG